MANQLAIVNMALGRLGTQASVQSLDEASPEAFNGKLFWDQAVDATLAEFDWRFAAATSALALSGSAPPPWTLQYALPADCLRARALVRRRPDWIPAGQPWPPQGLPVIRFARGLGTDTTGNQIPVLLTDEAAAILSYTARVSNPGLWEPGFVTAMTWRLAAELAVPITGKAELQQAMLQGWQQAVDSARLATAQEGTRDSSHTPDFMAARGGIGGCHDTFWGR